MLADSTLTWAGCFLADWTSQQPNLHPSSRCPCPSPCPRPPLLTKQTKPTHTHINYKHTTEKHSLKYTLKKTIRKIKLIKYIDGVRGRNAGCGKSSNVCTDKLCACGCRGDRPTYLAVSSAGHIHVKDELSVILGAVGPGWAAGGHKGRCLIIATHCKSLPGDYPHGVKEPLQGQY